MAGQDGLTVALQGQADFDDIYFISWKSMIQNTQGLSGPDSVKQTKRPFDFGKL